jgi:hypothetical protein
MKIIWQIWKSFLKNNGRPKKRIFTLLSEQKHDIVYFWNKLRISCPKYKSSLIKEKGFLQQKAPNVEQFLHHPCKKGTCDLNF